LSVKIRIDVKGVDRAEKLLRAASHDLLGQVGRRLVQQGQNNAPYQTGALRADIQVRRRTTKTLVVGTRQVKYAPIHEFGGTIRPKKKPYLHFKVGDKWVRTKQSRIRAKRYMARAAETVQGEVEEIARRVYKKYGF
jgi:phage gpG-like protein